MDVWCVSIFVQPYSNLTGNIMVNMNVFNVSKANILFIAGIVVIDMSVVYSKEYLLG